MFGPFSNCTEKPVLATQYEDISSTNAGDPLNNLNVGGYRGVTGQELNMQFQLYPGSNVTETPNPAYNVYCNQSLITNVTYDIWLYDQPALAGAVGLGPSSSYMDQLNNNATVNPNNTNQIVWTLELGNLVNQSFSGQSYNESSLPQLYIGDKNSIPLAQNMTGANVLQLQSNGSKHFEMNGVYFGKVLDTLPRFFNLFAQSVSGDVVAPGAVFATNLQGIQLPAAQFQQWIGLMTRISQEVFEDLVCDTADVTGGYQNNFCFLKNPCDSPRYTALWDYQFSFDFATSQPNMFVGMGSLAWDELGVCYLGVRGNLLYDYTVIGAFVMQNFAFLFDGTDPNNWQVSVSQTTDYTAPKASLSATKVNGTESAPVFPYVKEVVISFNPTATTSTYAFASLGNYADKKFLVSLNNSESFIYSTNCTFFGQNQTKACSDEPANAYLTWNMTKYPPTSSLLYANMDYDGYTLSGYNTQTNLCLYAEPSDQLLYGYSICGLTPTNNFWIVDQITGTPSWNAYSTAYSGILGLDNNSILWDVVYGSQSILQGITKTYELNYEKGIIVLGSYNQTNFNQTGNMTVNATQSDAGNIFSLSEFGFGRIWNDTSAYFTSLLNSDSTLYGSSTNQTILTTETPSMLLPIPLFKKFANLLAIITKGDATCLQQEGGYCVLPGTCSQYVDKFDLYSFKIQFADAENPNQWINLPLSSFAFDNQISLLPYYPNSNQCYIDIQPLESNAVDSKQIVFGADFFQYINMLRQSSSSINQMTLAISQQAPPTVSFQSFNYDVGASPFDITPVSFQSPSAQPAYGMPTVDQISSSPSSAQQSSLYIDLWASQTWMFSLDCSQALVNLTEKTCADFPVNGTETFNTSMSYHSASKVYSSSGFVFDGVYSPQTLAWSTYDTSGNLTGNHSSIQSIYAVNQIETDNWLYGTPQQAGSLALGPDSPLTLQFINPDLLVQEVSINYPYIIFGGHVSNNQTQSTSVIMNTDGSGNIYEYISFRFGEVYVENNQTTSEYTESIDIDNQLLGVQFLQNYPGLGLPTPLYSAFGSLLSNLSLNYDFTYTCDQTAGAQCVISRSCAELESLMSGFAFEIVFSNTNIVRVPVSTFYISDEQVNTDVCNIGVFYLNIDDPTSRNVLIGASFWQTFQANLTNQFDSNYNYTFQNIEIRANSNSIVSYAGNATLPVGPNPFLLAPHQYQCEINPFTYMPELYASFNSSDYQTFLIDNNAKRSLIWTTSCLQGFDGSVQHCSAAPTYVTEWYNLNQSFIAPNTYIGEKQGGYVTDGNRVTAPMVIPLYNDGNKTDTLNIEVNAVTDITSDAWLWNVNHQPSGQFALGWDSQWVMQQTNSQNQSVWGIEINTFDQTQSCKIFVGDGAYKNLYNQNTAQLLRQNTTDGTYNLYSMWFGYNSTETQDLVNYYLPLGYAGMEQKAIIALNYQGLGLPWYLWNQTATLLARTSHIVYSDLFIDDAEGIFYLLRPCKTPDYDDLWHYFFRVEMFQTTGNRTEYIQVPLASLAHFDTDLQVCKIYVQLLNSHEGIPMTDNVVLGSMFMQNFQMLFVNEYTASATHAGVAISVSEHGYGAQISTVVPTNNATGVFDYTPLFDLPVSCSSDSFLCTVGADIGSQGVNNYLVSFVEDTLYTLSRDCQDETTPSFRRCSSAQYFDTDPKFGEPVGDIYITQQIYLDGVETTVETWNQTACLSIDKGQLPYCTPTNVEFYVGESVSQDNWGFFDSNAAGIIGFAPGSPIYNIINPVTGSQYQNFTFAVSNFTDWSFAQQNKSVVGNNYGLAFGQTYFNSTFSTETIVYSSPSNSMGAGAFSVLEFNFGQAIGMNYQTSELADVAQSFESINNQNSATFGSMANQTLITPSFRGLGLPDSSYSRFANLLSIASGGASNCDGISFCVLAKSCDTYPKLWAYQFQVVFNNVEGAQQALYIPLATFATTNQQTGTCRIYVEKLSSPISSSVQKQIILGSMFFQSFAYQQVAISDNQTQVVFMRNPNALDNAFISFTNFTVSTTSVFQVEPVNPSTSTPAASQPTFESTVGGTSSNTYTIDYTSDSVLLWSVNCTSNLGSNTSCAAAPNLIQPNFVAANAKAVWQSSYSSVMIGGYETDGQIYLTEICTDGGSLCKVMNVHVADKIKQNNWNFNVTGAAGILGYGPRSPFWQAYIGTDGNAYSSTVLAIPTNSTTAAANRQGAYYNTNDITFGSLGSYSTYNTSNLLMTSNLFGESPVYDVQSIGFGETYTSSNTAYYENFTAATEAVFTPAFEGMGMTSKLYTWYSTLVKNATNTQSTAVCTSNTDASCTLPGQCSSYSQLYNLAFQVNFTTASNQTYINVPLSAFLYNQDNGCNIGVVNLGDASGNAQNIVFGANFYQAFFVAQQSVYTLVNGKETLVGVDLSMFVSHDNAFTSAYIGNQLYAPGTNPFLPVSPSPTPSSAETTWIIALVIVVLVLAGFLGWAVYKWRVTAQQQQNEPQYMVYDKDKSSGEPMMHSSGNINDDEDGL